MKILLISPTKEGIGGIGQHVHGLYQFLTNKNHKVDVISSENTFTKEIPLKKNINVTKAKTNLSWSMPNLNYENFLGNIYLSGIDDFFLKKKIGKDKFSIQQSNIPILVLEHNIIFSDDTGTIFNINDQGRIIWKKNIYKKTYKGIFKNLLLSAHEDYIYVADNVGFVYSINIKNGDVIWIKNYEIPIKSNIKVFDSKIFLINHDNCTFFNF